MTVIHQTWNESTSRLYGSRVEPPFTLTFPTVNSARCQMRNSRIATPPQRIQCEENDERLFFFMTYFVVRARFERRQRRAAHVTWITRAPISTTRIAQRIPSWGISGSPMERRWAAYSL